MLSILLAVGLAHANSDYCRISSDVSSFSSRILNAENRLSFENPPGYLNWGVCWWHSRFQRAAEYLAVFEPTQPKPEPWQIWGILESIAFDHHVTVIPGYANLFEFSQVNREQIEVFLSQWQIHDSVERASWVNGLAGRSSTSSEKFWNLMTSIHERLQSSKQILYVKLQNPGVAAHAWLIVNSQKRESEILFTVIDSNDLLPVQILVKKGDQSLGSFGVPYLQEDRELRSIFLGILEHCQPKTALRKYIDGLNHALKKAVGKSEIDRINRLITQATLKKRVLSSHRANALKPEDLDPKKWFATMEAIHE